MKKVFTIICLISAILIAPPVRAEYDSVDKMMENGLSLTDIVHMIEADTSLLNELSQISLNEIAVMELLLERELQRRDYVDSGVVVPMGEYTVGIDIPSGAYSIRLAHPDSVPYSAITIHSVSGTFDGLYYLSDAEAVIGKVTLKDGQTVKISSDSVLFSPYKGLGF